jgi:hypothetical protein
MVHASVSKIRPSTQDASTIVISNDKTKIQCGAGSLSLFPIPLPLDWSSARLFRHIINTISAPMPTTMHTIDPVNM